jgi:ribosomal-protein-alanine N-acetyltransferase
LNTPQKTGQRLSIRLIQKNDAKAVYDLFSHSSVCEFYDLLPFKDPNQAVEQIEKWLKNYDQDKQIRYAICEDNYVIGTCGLYSIYRHQNRANLGYDLLPSKWNKGYMTEALQMFLQLCFQDWNFHRIQALVLPENTSSVRLLSKFGFTSEGILKDFEKWPRRGYVDLQIFALIKDE